MNKKVLSIEPKKNWTQYVHLKTAQDLIFRKYDKSSKFFIAHQNKFESQWMNAVPCKNLGLKFDDQQILIPIRLRLGANIWCCVYVSLW